MYLGLLGQMFWDI